MTGDPQGTAPSAPSSAWRTLLRSLRPRSSRSQLLAGLLCGVLGFAVVVQVRQNQVEGLSTLPQSELVRILDQANQRTEELEREAAALEATRQELLSGSDQQQAALEAATEAAAIQGILSGRLPAQGPGIELVVADPDGRVPALTLFNVLEELRNAGAEAVQLNDRRIVASSHFVDTSDGVEVDGELLEPPYRWLAIGDPDTLGPALEIPGGALSAVRNNGGTGTPRARTLVEVTATRPVPEPRFATPVPADGG
ncbi:DUF881 domain-containing protein [Cellulomonas aerilata]|uniref:Uncharacterized protein n=1 Tax=Cellulomonas aerilata TaxID=515326 RepID=A0A512DAG3_9CELL|nr:DUF881 domain-containing protein [Cellulomonas aerilata]GEO33471.1 hypothetical protein CAE01nite_11960 [Cellulomonas aerilata]